MGRTVLCLATSSVLVKQLAATDTHAGARQAVQHCLLEQARGGLVQEGSKHDTISE